MSSPACGYNSNCAQKDMGRGWGGGGGGGGASTNAAVSIGDDCTQGASYASANSGFTVGVEWKGRMCACKRQAMLNIRSNARHTQHDLGISSGSC